MRLCFVALLVLGACKPAEATGAPPGRPQATDPQMFAQHGSVLVHTANGDVTFAVELALTDKERQRGLMYRDTIGDDAGMLFVFEREQQQAFWMKNTRIPLDMVFIKADGTILGIVENAEPETLMSRRVDGASRYVLEIAGGMARKRGIAAGQRVRFEGVPVDKIDPRVLQ
jgi:uncharacterized membrane protein (UPF0127 family)